MLWSNAKKNAAVRRHFVLDFEAGEGGDEFDLFAV